MYIKSILTMQLICNMSSMKSNKTKIIGLLVTLLIVIIAALSLTKKTESEVKIGALYVLSGPVSSIGEVQMSATELAVEKINSTGGINGKKLVVDIQDSAFDPKKALDAYYALQHTGHKYFIADGSPIVASIHPKIIEDKNFSIAVAATTPVYLDDSNRTCRIALRAEQFGSIIHKMSEQEGIKTISVLIPNNEYGKGIHASIVNSFGESLVQAEFYDVNSIDYRTSITKLIEKQSTSDGLFVINVSANVETMFKQLGELGWKKQIFSDYYTINNPNLKDSSIVRGIVYADYDYVKDVQPNDSKEVVEFKNLYTKRFGKKPVFIAAATYDSIILLAEGLRNADQVEGVANYISGLKNYQAITGNLSFNSSCEVNRDVVIRKVN